MECCVCLEPLDKMIKVVTPCKHELCIKCFIELIDPLCPLCRNNLKPYIPHALVKTTKAFNIDDPDDFPTLSG